MCNTLTVKELSRLQGLVARLEEENDSLKEKASFAAEEQAHATEHYRRILGDERRRHQDEIALKDSEVQNVGVQAIW